MLKNVLYKLSGFEEDVITCAYIGIRDYECVSIEWPSRAIYCCIYNDAVDIDKCWFTPPDKVDVNHTTECVLMDDIDTEFILKFEKIWF